MLNKFYRFLYKLLKLDAAACARRNVRLHLIFEKGVRYQTTMWDPEVIREVDKELSKRR